MGALSLLEPALTVDGALDALGFESVNGAATVVSVNGVEVASWRTRTAAIFSRRSIWTALISRSTMPARSPSGSESNSAQPVANICPNCGEINDGSSEHTTLISEFCDEDIRCVGDPFTTAIPGEDYPCSKSNSHTTCIVCGEPWC
ncbi:MAG: hypothetical protein ACLVJ6_15825 [Merdibacter sp.]